MQSDSNQQGRAALQRCSLARRMMSLAGCMLSVACCRVLVACSLSHAVAALECAVGFAALGCACLPSLLHGLAWSSWLVQHR